MIDEMRGLYEYSRQLYNECMTMVFKKISETEQLLLSDF